MARIDIKEIQGLVRTDVSYDHKGSPVGVLEILGEPVLYASEDTVLAPGSDYWNDLTATHLARILAKALLETGVMEGWSLQSPTGREVRRLGPKED